MLNNIFEANITKYKRRMIMAKNRKQNRASNKSSKNANKTNTSNVKVQNNSRNESKPDDVPRRDGPGGN